MLTAVPRVYVSSRGHAGVSFGCLGSLLYLFAMLLWWTLVIVVVGAVIAALLLAFLAVWAAVGVDALLMRTSKRYAAKRTDRGPLDWPQRMTGAMASSRSRGRRAATRR